MAAMEGDTDKTSQLSKKVDSSYEKCTSARKALVTLAL